MCVVCVCLCVCMKDGSQVAAPDVLTQLHLCAQECTERRKREKRESRSMLDAVCVPPLGKEYSPMPYTQNCMSALTQSCVFCKQGRTVGCSLLALLMLIKIKKPKCVFVCVYEEGQLSCSS